jgi:hypothetical protein
VRFGVSTAEVYSPDGLVGEQALARTTDRAIGAHHDDIEIMAFNGILELFRYDARWFCGVVVTDPGRAARPCSRSKRQEIRCLNPYPKDPMLRNHVWAIDHWLHLCAPGPAWTAAGACCCPTRSRKGIEQDLPV